MRTTLDIDDDILQAAKELGRAERKPAGKVLSDLARKALTVPSESGEPNGPAGTILKDGWYVLPKRGNVVTSELVKRLMEEADMEDVERAKRR